MKFNFLILFITALVPLIIGFIWYGPLFKNAWMKEIGFTENSMKGANMPLIFGLTYFMGLLISSSLIPLVVHQMGIFSTLAGEPGFNEKTGEAFQTFISLMETYGGRFRTFKHGAFHGILVSLFMAMPLITIKSLFERKSFKYIALHSGYWIVCLAIMGGIICQWI